MKLNIYRACADINEGVGETENMIETGDKRGGELICLARLKKGNILYSTFGPLMVFVWVLYKQYEVHYILCFCYCCIKTYDLLSDCHSESSTS